jgi:hypothetical protein
MTPRRARTAANVALGLGCVAAAFVVVTTPPLRRLALRATRVWLGATVPVFLLNQVREAWAQSGRTAT